MTPHLIPHYGPHAHGLVIAGRPVAYPGIYVPAGVVAQVNLCDWFDPLAESAWSTAAAGEWSGHSDGTRWALRAGDGDWILDSAGGWRRRKPCA